MRTADIVVVGGGPAGLAVAIGAAQRGLETLVLERGSYPLDKACGEGLMPNGLAVLERLGVRRLLPSDECSVLEGIRYVQEDGRAVEGRLPEPGLGIRRLALVTAMRARAREVGVEVRELATVRSHARVEEGVRLETDAETVLGRVVVAADGLASPLRRAAGLEGPPGRHRRFGLRQHFHTAPWTSFVEVHLSRGVEAYLTPTGPNRVGLAFLWEDGELEGTVRFAELLRRFPVLQHRLAGAQAASEPRGAGPLLQRVRALSSDRLVLVGDAAGYVDAITGEGLSVAFEAASALVEVLPEALRQEGARAAFRPYEQTHRRLFRHYAWTTNAVLALARRPWLRRSILQVLQGRPSLFEKVLALAVGPRPARTGQRFSAGGLPSNPTKAGTVE